MENRPLRYFIAVAIHLNYSEAARELFVSPPTLSKQISELEDQLGLAERIKNPVITRVFA